jgi:hypothetical protein
MVPLVLEPGSSKPLCGEDEPHAAAAMIVEMPSAIATAHPCQELMETSLSIDAEPVFPNATLVKRRAP